jgi:hypothetical protein
MRSMKLLQSACMLAVACGVMTTVEAIAQTRDKPGSSQVRKTSTQAKAKAHQQRKQADVKHARQGKKKSVTATTRPSKKPALATARTLPPPVAWVPPPLGPERFYPNGIPELRPEFMHPERPPARVDQAANSRPASAGGQPTEWLP